MAFSMPSGDLEGMRNAAHDYELLATYNAECARGIMHRPDWSARMSIIQERFNREMRGMQNAWDYK